jgi:predicted Zn-dependent protease
VIRTLAELDTVKAQNRLVLDAGQQPDDMQAQIRGAEVLLTQGKPAEAATMLERATRRIGKTPAAAKLLARAYREVGRPDLAAEWERFAGGQ